MDKEIVILLLEDDEQVRDLIAPALVEAGYALVIQAEFGERTLKQNMTVNPDLAIVDLHLTGSVLNGLDVLKYLKGQSPELKVIVISGYHDWKETALKAGADVFMEKPFKIRELLETIKKLLEAE